MIFRILVVALVAGVALTLVVAKPWKLVPPHWNPWAPLAIVHPPTPVTLWKLSRLETSPRQCLAVLENTPPGAVDYLPLADYEPVPDCPLQNVVRVKKTDLNFSSPYTITCPLLVRWLMFENQQLQPLAFTHFASSVRTVNHFGSFSCRNVYHRESGRRSQHATASALDVSEFILADNTRINVLRDWQKNENSTASKFLHDVHEAACRYFGTVLGPDYNRPHENHFHFGVSSYRLCH